MDDTAHVDSRIYMRVDWAGYQSVELARGEKANPRITYLDGVLELMSPGQNHEAIIFRLNQLVVAYCLARHIYFGGYGAWTQRNQDVDAAAEPDSCFAIGHPVGERPDLVIEVVWTSGGLDKLEVYRRLGIPEVWFWIKNKLTIHVLACDAYEERMQSDALPDLDFDVVQQLLELEDTPEAMRRMTEYAQR
ncbi:MAG: Uma2 family endonuclease [Kofleriaceae bacterium]